MSPYISNYSYRCQVKDLLPHAIPITTHHLQLKCYAEFRSIRISLNDQIELF